MTVNTTLRRLAKLAKYSNWPNGVTVVNFIFQRVIGKNKSVPHGVHFTSIYQGPENYTYNKHCKSILASFACSSGCYFTAFENTSISIGDGTIWAPNVCIQTGNHDLLDRSIYHCKSVSIGRNCWIGFGAVILAGVELGDNVTVGANAVVTRSFPDNSVVAGVPARLIKSI